MIIKGYELVNADKLTRAAEGTLGSNGESTGGVGYDNEDLLLAQYDKLGGLITNPDGYKVKTGSFFDAKKNKPIEKPAPMLVIRIEGEEVEVPEGKPLPMEVRASKILKESKAKKAAEKKAKVDEANDKSTLKKGTKTKKVAPVNEVEE